MPRDVAIVSFAETPAVRREWERDEVEMLVPVIAEALERSGIGKKEIGFTCSGSSDFLTGRPFSFVIALDALGAWPPIQESHVEMDGAFALYEAWVRLQHGDVDTALVYGFGKSSLGSLREIMTLQLDPYYLVPLGLDQTSYAGLQASALDAQKETLAGILRRSRHDGRANPHALDVPDDQQEPPITDGAAAVVLAVREVAEDLVARPAHITGIAHRIEPHYLGMR